MIPNGQPGVVKAWIEGRGMGFITPNDGSPDVFVHRSCLVDGDALAVGAHVMFEAGFDPQKGKPIAKVCSGAIPGGSAGPPPMAPITPAFSPGYGGPSFANGGKGGPKLMRGIVKVWFADKKYGFITLDNGMGDAFLGSSAVPPGMALYDGMHISFTASWNAEKQKYTAVQVMPDSSKGKGKGVIGAPAGAGDPPPSDNCFVTGLPHDITEEALQDLFSCYGNVISCKVLPGEGRPDRAALIRFSSVEEATWIVETVNGNLVSGLENPVNVRFATSKSSPPSGHVSSFPGVASSHPPGKGGGASTGGCGIRPTSQVQAAQIGTVKAVMENSLVVTPSEGGPDLHVPKIALLDGRAEVGGLVSFSKDEGRSGKGYGKALGGAPSNRFAPYGGPAGASGRQDTGTVKAWMENRGMGFIAPDDGSQDLFVHRSYLADGGSLVVGAPVTFTPDFDQQKRKAIAVNVHGAIPQPAPGMM